MMHRTKKREREREVNLIKLISRLVVGGIYYNCSVAAVCSKKKETNQGIITHSSCSVLIPRERESEGISVFTSNQRLYLRKKSSKSNEAILRFYTSSFHKSEERREKKNPKQAFHVSHL